MLILGCQVGTVLDKELGKIYDLHEQHFPMA
jgi:hypothetical protein